MNECYSCIYRKDIAGDTHSTCEHPDARGTDGLMTAMFMQAGMNVKVANKLNIEGDPHGISHGWFFWPMNFDPVWLRNCDGFVEKPEILVR